MTTKEVEHFLIENDFEYIKDKYGAFWRHNKKRYGVSDSLVEESPDEAFQRVKEMIRNASSWGRE